jgi:uncharacterized protein (DUF1697 family)
MTVFIVLFRGVGGATQLPVKQLREVLTAAGFENVATYINSGNAVAKTSLSQKKATELIAEVCRREMGFVKDILLVAEKDWSRAIDENPYPEAVKVPTSIHLFALSAEPKPETVETLKTRKHPSESLQVSGTFMYFHAPEGFGPSKTPPVIDRTLGVVTTARNWNTVLKMQELAKAAR